MQELHYSLIFQLQTQQREADDYARYLVSCAAEGAEILHLSNPGDYDEDDYDDDYEIVEVDD